jgi:hypothetical protein
MKITCKGMLINEEMEEKKMWKEKLKGGKK